MFGTRGRVAVRGSLNGKSIREYALPGGNGTHYLVLNRELRKATGISPGETVDVVLELDTKSRTVRIPTDLREELARTPGLMPAFDRLGYTDRRNIVRQIESARRPETRARRIDAVVSRLRDRMRRT